MLTEIVAAPRAWHGPTLAPDHYLLPIPDECLRELDAVVAELRRAPVPTLLLLARPLPARRLRAPDGERAARLDEGAGFVMLDRLPLDRMSAVEAIASTGSSPTSSSRRWRRSGRAP